ncbi:MAG: hypothetical protein V1789_08600 [PVC group bacterium]
MDTMDKKMMQVVIFLGDYIVYGMVVHYAGATLDSLLEMDRDEFLEIKNARIFTAGDSRELYSLSRLEVNKSRVILIFLEDSVISRGE